VKSNIVESGEIERILAEFLNCLLAVYLWSQRRITVHVDGDR
jgi:hypothetical protein